MKIVIIGTGYVGLTTGVALAYTGHNVIAVDKDIEKLKILTEGYCPIHEPGIDQLICHTKNHLSFSASLPDSINGVELIIIAVGTPSGPNGEADIRSVEEVAIEIADCIKNGDSFTIAIKSTVPIGTNKKIEKNMKDMLSVRGINARAAFVSNPEFLREGVALQDTFYPDRIVVGSDDPDAIDTLYKAYKPILEQTFTPPAFLVKPDNCRFPHLVTTDLMSAEMIKYASNCFLALKISYINEIAGLCEKVGADVTEVSRGIGLDSRIGHRFLDAGLGWGGSCFPKDTSALIATASKYNYQMPIISASREINNRQRTLIVDKLNACLGDLNGKKIGMLGLAFKPNTDDIRDSAAIDIINMLLVRGVHVVANDPVAISNAKQLLSESNISFTDDMYEIADNADAIILATEWDQYCLIDLGKLGEKMKNRIIVDGRNMFDPEDAKQAGFRYFGVGR